MNPSGSQLVLVGLGASALLAGTHFAGFGVAHTTGRGLHCPPDPLAWLLRGHLLPGMLQPLNLFPGTGTKQTKMTAPANRHLKNVNEWNIQNTIPSQIIKNLISNPQGLPQNKSHYKTYSSGALNNQKLSAWAELCLKLASELISVLFSFLPI